MIREDIKPGAMVAVYPRGYDNYVRAIKKGNHPSFRAKFVKFVQDGRVQRIMVRYKPQKDVPFKTPSGFLSGLFDQRQVVETQ